MAKKGSSTLKQRGAGTEKEKETTNTETKNETDASGAEAKPKKRYKERKQLPPVGFLLAHGDPESWDKPKNIFEIVVPPILLAITFGISLMVFHHMPKSSTPRKPHNLPLIPEPVKVVKEENYDPIKLDP